MGVHLKALIELNVAPLDSRSTLVGFSLLSYTKTTRPKEAKTFQKISMAQKYFEFGEKSKKIFLPIIKIKLPC